MYSGGKGTLIDPYLINNLQDFNDIQFNVNANFKQTADIILGESFVPIGYGVANSFAGVYDGNNYSLKDGVINFPDDSNIGIFTNIVGGNIQFKNIFLKNIKVIGRGSLGCLVGKIYNCGPLNIFNCHTDENCAVSASAQTDTYTGGIVGSISNISTSSSVCIEKCSNAGLVAGFSTVGGIVGYMNYGSIKNCYNTGDIFALFQEAGGIVGLANASSGYIQYCYNSGTISCSNYGGGIAGYATCTGGIINCFSLGYAIRKTCDADPNNINFGRIHSLNNSYDNNNYATKVEYQW